MTLQEKLEHLLVTNKLSEAIDLAMLHIKNADKDYYNTLILLKSQFSSNETDFGKSLIDSGDYKRTKARITNGFQNTVNMFPVNVLDKILEEEKNNINNNENMLNELEIQGYKENLELMIRKKNALSKALITAYDEEKKIALEEQIKELEGNINELKNKLGIQVTREINDKLNINTNLFEFKTELNKILDNKGFVGVIEVFQKIENSEFEYNKSAVSNLRNDAISQLTALSPDNFITRMKIFIDSIK